MSVTSTTYISQADLMAWLQSKTSALYGLMGEAMDAGQIRSSVQDKLAQVKAALQNCKGNQDHWTEVYQGLQEAQALCGAPELTDLRLELAKLRLDIDANGRSDEGIKTSVDRVTDKIDSLGKVDQLCMIRVQELNSAINQDYQMASNLLASSNQTQGALVTAIKG